MAPTPTGPDVTIHDPEDGARRYGSDGVLTCEVLEIVQTMVTICVDTAETKHWRSGRQLFVVVGGLKSLPATIQSLHSAGQVQVVVLRADRASLLEPERPSSTTGSSNQREAYRTRVEQSAEIEVTVRPEVLAPAGRGRETFPGFLLDASFEGICVLVDGVAEAALSEEGLVRVQLATPTGPFEVFGAVRRRGTARHGLRLGIETGSFPHAEWPESQEQGLRDFVVEQQRIELERRRSA